jgi:hypothetical protein
MWPFAAVGWAVGLWLLWVVLANPVERGSSTTRSTSAPSHRSRSRQARSTSWPRSCPPSLSSHRWLRAFGAVNLVGAVVVFAAHKAAFASLWCFWAALASVLVLAHLRRRR